MQWARRARTCKHMRVHTHAVAQCVVCGRRWQHAKIARMWMQLACQKAAAKTLPTRRAESAQRGSQAPRRRTRMRAGVKFCKNTTQTWRQFCCQKMDVFSLPEIRVIIENYIYLQKRRRICIHLMAAKSLPLLLGPTWNFISALQPMCEFVQKVLPFSGNGPLPHFSNVSPSARGSPQQPPAMSTATGVCQCVCVCVCG